MADNPLVPQTPATESYWYDSEHAVVDILSALRTFRHADQEMRRRMSVDMDMNLTDLQAVQLTIAAERAGHAVTPRELASALHISTASTTKLLDRLTDSGHLARTPHPTDRRSLVVVATEHAHREVRERLSDMHRHMAEVARDVPEESRPAVAGFLRRMAAQLDREGATEPLTPGPRA